jgi:hypothetical protein
MAAGAVILFSLKLQSISLEETRTMVFCTIVAFQWFNALNRRSTQMMQVAVVRTVNRSGFSLRREWGFRKEATYYSRQLQAQRIGKKYWVRVTMTHFAIIIDRTLSHPNIRTWLYAFSGVIHGILYRSGIYSCAITAPGE